MDFAKHHCPNTLLKDNAQFYEKADASLVTKMVNAISVYVCSVFSDTDREQVIQAMMSAFDDSNFLKAVGPIYAILSLLLVMQPYLIANPIAVTLNNLIDQILGLWVDVPVTYLGTLADNMNKTSLLYLKLALADNPDEEKSALLLMAIMDAMPSDITYEDQFEVAGYVIKDIIDHAMEIALDTGKAILNWVMYCIDKCVENIQVIPLSPNSATPKILSE